MRYHRRCESTIEDDRPVRTLTVAAPNGSRVELFERAAP